MSKHPFSLNRLIPLLLQIEEEIRKWPSTASDAKEPERKAKNLMQKFLNKCGLLEISDQQATAAVMGHDSFISSHKFAFMEPWKAVAMHRKLYDAEQLREKINYAEYLQETDELLTNLEIIQETRKATSLSTLDRYLQRGEQLQKYSLYMYTLVIGHRKPLKNKSSRKNKGGRPDNPTFPYATGSKASKCFEQIMKSNPTIPRISGRKPPAYPGDEPGPTESESKINSWRIQAKNFVEFYCLVFLPFDANLQLINPYKSILPFNDSSWVEFWKVFNSFENSKNFYGRAIWFIFNNMVDNLRQNKTDTELVMKWRFWNADAKTGNVFINTSNENFDKDRLLGDCDQNDLEAIRDICDSICEKYGHDRFYQTNRKKEKKLNNF